jgi:hypothetical protein
MFLIRPDDWVYYVADDDEPWEYDWLSFVGTKADISIMHTAFAVTPYVKPDSIEGYVKLYEEIKSYDYSDHEQNLRLIAMLNILLADLIRDFPSTATVQVTDYKTREFYKLLSFIHRHADDTLLIGTISREFGYDRSHLSWCYERSVLCDCACGDRQHRKLHVS